MQVLVQVVVLVLVAEVAALVAVIDHHSGSRGLPFCCRSNQKTGSNEFQQVRVFFFVLLRVFFCSVCFFLFFVMRVFCFSLENDATHAKHVQACFFCSAFFVGFFGRKNRDLLEKCKYS